MFFYFTYVCILRANKKKNRLLLLENEFAVSVHNAFLFPDADGPSTFPASVLVGVKISIFFRGHFVVQIIFLNLKATHYTVKTLPSYLLPETKTHYPAILC